MVDLYYLDYERPIPDDIHGVGAKAKDWPFFRLVVDVRNGNCALVPITMYHAIALVVAWPNVMIPFFVSTACAWVVVL